MKNLKTGLITAVIISILMSCVVLVTCAVDYDSIGSMENLLEDGGFEEGCGNAIVNEGDPGETAVMTRVGNQQTAVSNRVIKIVSRTADEDFLNNGLCYDITSLMKQKDGGSYKIQDANGCLYVSAKIKLENPSDTVYARPVIFGWAPGGAGIGQMFLSDDGTINYPVTGSEWTDLGIKSGEYYRNFAIYEMTAAKLDNANQKIKLMFSVSSNAAMNTPYTGSYYIDDVSLFFVEGVNHTASVTRKPGMLENSDFEQLSGGNPIDYSATTADSWTGNGSTTWFASGAVIQNELLSEPDPNAPLYEPAGVHTGKAGILISGRTGTHQGISVNMKPIADALGALKANEKYHLSIWMKAKAPGTTIKVSPIWGGNGNAYLNGDADLAFDVTDQWTEVGFNMTGDEYYAFKREGEEEGDFNPQDGEWSAIRFKTDGMQDYYADDFKVMKYMPPTQAELDALEAKKFNDRVDALFPVTLDKKADIKAARAKYNSLSDGIKALCNLSGLIQAETELQKLINDGYKQFAETPYKRGDNLLLNGGFEKGFLPAFYANRTEDTGKAADITLVSKQEAGTGHQSKALYVKDRASGEKIAGPQYDMFDILKSNGSKGTYFMSAKIKLDNKDDTAYICPYLQGGNPDEDTADDNAHSVKLMLAGGTAYQINGKEYTEIGLGTDGAYIPFSICDKNSGLTDESIALTKWFKFHFQMYGGSVVSNDTPAYSGNYLIDDITLWFVPDGSMPSDGSITVIGPNLLDDGTFETDYDYDAEPETSLTWYPSRVEAEDARPAEKGCTLAYKTVSTEPASTVDAYGVHAGNFGVKVTNRPGANQGVAINMKRLVDKVGALAENEHYYISFYMRAETGKEFFVIPIFGAKAQEGESNSNGYVGGAEPNIKVTDQWTHVGFDITRQQYMAFMKEDKSKFDPYGREWASIRLQTAGETFGVFDNYYMDDVNVWVSDSAGSGKTGDQSNMLITVIIALSAAMLIAVCKKTKLFNEETSI